MVAKSIGQLEVIRGGAEPGPRGVLGAAALPRKDGQAEGAGGQG